MQCSAVIYADQSEFDRREEQQLRPHNFDVKHYRISFAIEENTNSFDGETEVTFFSSVDGTSEITLDSESFTVSRVTDEAGADLHFVQQKGHLEISLGQALASNETATLTIAYSAANVEGNTSVGLDFRDKTESNPRLVNSLNWPNGARYWFPSFDHPGDRATHETIITVKKSWKVLGNGTLVSDLVNAETGRRTVHWSQSKPHLPLYVCGGSL